LAFSKQATIFTANQIEVFTSFAL